MNTHELEYYNISDVREITGCSQNLGYDIIRRLQAKFKEDFPDTIILQGRIPKWYFEEKMMNKKKEV